MADLSKQVPNNSYGPVVVYYIDKPFNCIDCGKSEVWTAHQQKWYYEVAKGSLYATAIRCRNCRKRRADLHNGKGDPNPKKHIATLMKRLRSKLEPFLLQAGFRFDGKIHLPSQWTIAIHYSKDQLLFACTYNRVTATLICETLDPLETYTEIARVTLTKDDTSLKIVERIDEFAGIVKLGLQTQLMEKPAKLN